MKNADIGREIEELEATIGAHELTIAALRITLRQTVTMLDESLAPQSDHAEAFAWIERRKILVEEARDLLQGEDADAN